MSTRRPHLILALALLTACGGDGPVDPGNGGGGGSTVASVTVSPASASILVGATQQFSASATDTNGGNVTGATVSWSSSNSSVASVTSAGLATGVASGTAAITATISGVAGSQVLSVTPVECSNRQEVSLEAGERTTYEANQCILLPAGSAGNRYRVAVIRPSQATTETNVTTATVTATAISSSANAVAALSNPQATEAHALPKIDGTVFVENFARRQRTRLAHDILRQRERDMGFSKETLLPSRPLLSPALLADPPATMQINNALTCSGSTTTHGLITFNDDIAIYQDEASASASPFSVASANIMVNYYSSYIRDMINDNFGGLSDIDGNGRLLVTSSASIPSEGVAAAWQGDLQDASACPGGNRAEIAYYLASFFNEMADDNANWGPLGTLAHEAKHISSLYNRLQGGQGNHPNWIEEGTADLAEEMASRIAWAATGGPAITERADAVDILTSVQNNTNRQTMEMWGVIDRMTGIIIQLSTHPNSLTSNPTGSHEFHSFYHASWHFHRFIADAYGAGPGDAAALITALNAPATAAGTAGLAAVTGTSYDDLFLEMITAMSLHATAGPDPARTFTTYDLVSATNIFTAPEVLTPPGRYPWPVTTTAAENESAEFVTGSYSGEMGLAGIRQHDFLSAGTNSLQLEFEVGQPSKIVVTRIR